MTRARGCVLWMVAIVAWAAVGLVWSIGVGDRHSIVGFLASIVQSIAGSILILALAVFILSLRRILDWIIVRHPPLVQDPALGDVRYDDGRWHARIGAVSYSFEGRRGGPDAAYLRVGAEAAPRLAELERRAREFAHTRCPGLTTIGPLESVTAHRRKGQAAPSLELWFEMSKDPEDLLRVEIDGDSPTHVECPNPVGPR